MGASGDEYNLINYEDFNTIYLMDIYLGSELDYLDVVFDTGSSWLIVQSENCGLCSGSMWDETQSTTFIRDYPYVR